MQSCRQTSIVNEPVVTVAHWIGLLNDGNDAALGQRQVHLLRRLYILSDNVELWLIVVHTYTRLLGFCLTPLRYVVTLQWK